MSKNIHQLVELTGKVVQNIEQVIVGKREAIELMLVGLYARGHVLLEDLPGLGKTTLVKCMARSFACDFKRVQFTPDLLPSDILGTSVYNQQSCVFEFKPGPVFAQFLLADEINRTSPKTQASLLEAMEERQVTVDGRTQLLPEPFMVFATQNPIEHEGTFPLPEAQMDRFLLTVNIGYPDRDAELEITRRITGSSPAASLSPVAGSGDVLALQRAVDQVFVSEAVRMYAVDLVRKTREHGSISLGASPRSAIGLLRAARAYAFIKGRDHVLPDDIKVLAVPVLAHRLRVSYQSRVQGETEAKVLSCMLSEGLEVPVGAFAALQGR